jgi:hypothetical protein
VDLPEPDGETAQVGVYPSAVRLARMPSLDTVEKHARLTEALKQY